MTDLLEKQYEECVMFDKISQSDGYGATLPPKWVEGAHFRAFCRFDNSMEARAAEKNGVTGLYTIITPEKVNLQYHDVFKRLRDGKIFRVTSDGDDFEPPKGSTIRAKYVSAEEWELK